MSLRDLFKQSELPQNLVVSTMSVTFAFEKKVDSTPLSLDLQHISDSLMLCTSGICCTDYKGNLLAAEGRQNKKRKKRKAHNFYNSMTMEVAVCPTHGSDVPKTMHFKLFRNGSIQGAGCKNTRDGDYAIGIVRESLERVLGVELNIIRLKVNLINANFKLGHGINRDALYRLLISIGESTTYERCKHAGVGVKFLPKDKDKPISIFVFESGSVVITGSKNEKHIMEGYRFITELVRKYYNEVFKLPSSTLLHRIMNTSPLSS